MTNHPPIKTSIKIQNQNKENKEDTPSSKEFYCWRTYNHYKLTVTILLALTVLVLTFFVAPGAQP